LTRVTETEAIRGPKLTMSETDERQRSADKK